jgi:hypothetical protein
MNRFLLFCVVGIVVSLTGDSLVCQSLQWRLLSTPSFTGRADDIFFIDPNTGWFINYGSQRSRVIKTTDGGWRWFAAFDTTFSYGGPFRSIGFLDSLNGFIGSLADSFVPLSLRGIILFLSIS